METALGRSQHGIRHNTRVKVYPSGAREILTASRSVFREAGWELSDKWDNCSTNDSPVELDAESVYYADERRAIADEDGAASAAAAAAARLRAQRRARTQVRNLALSNRFSYFVTLTLDAQRVDRYNIAAVTRKLNQWLDNAVRRHGLAYVLVPELHKDGAIHFHGFFNDALRVVDSGTVIPPEGGKPRRPRSRKQREAWLAAGGHVVYNMPQWSLGFTTAIELYGDYRAAVGYVCKYINKEQTKVGGRWFYHGGDLRMPDVYFDDLNIEDVEAAGADTFETDTLDGVYFAVLRIDENGGIINGRIEQKHGAEGRPPLAVAARQGDSNGGGVRVHGRDAAAR